MATEKRDKVYWHDAFFAALQLEFHDYIDVLTFIDEHQLKQRGVNNGRFNHQKGGERPNQHKYRQNIPDAQHH